MRKHLRILQPHQGEVYVTAAEIECGDKTCVDTETPNPDGEHKGHLQHPGCPHLRTRGFRQTPMCALLEAELEEAPVEGKDPEWPWRLRHPSCLEAERNHQQFRKQVEEEKASLRVKRPYLPSHDYSRVRRVVSRVEELWPTHPHIACYVLENFLEDLAEGNQVEDINYVLITLDLEKVTPAGYVVIAEVVHPLRKNPWIGPIFASFLYRSAAICVTHWKQSSAAVTRWQQPFRWEGA